MKLLNKILLSLYQFILHVSPKAWVAEMFRLSGESLGVQSCVCAGTLGEFEAQLSDRSVLGYYLIHHNWEPENQKLLSSLTEPGNGTFIDVGANVGFTLIPLKKRFPDMAVIAVEADNVNYGHLKRNIERNLIGDVSLHNCAVYSNDGELFFELSIKNTGDHRVHFESEEKGEDHYDEADREVVKVKCARLDSLVDSETLVSPVGMKCDIQGSEVHFLHGADSIMKKVDWLVIEYWPYGLLRAGSKPKEFFEYLSKYFSKGGIIEHAGSEHISMKSIKELEQTISDSLLLEVGTAHYDLLFVKDINY